MATARVHVEDEAFVTLSTNDSYCLGALVLGHSLLQSGTTRTLACLITPTVSQGMRVHLSRVFDKVIVVDVLDSQDSANLALLNRPELGVTLTKLHCWRLLEFKKCVFMDADCLVLQNIDDLFGREELSAAPDIGWPDCFNTGVFVFQPNSDTYDALLQLAVTEGSFDGGDQGLLNTFFSGWSTQDIARHLPFIYNMSASAVYTYSPAFKRFASQIKVVHFLGAVKPWHHSYNTDTHRVGPYPGANSQDTIHHVQAWWDVFMACVQPHLEPSYSIQRGGSTTLHVTTSAVSGGGGEKQDERQWQQAWEQGRIDYMGADSFDNIMQRLQDTVDSAKPGGNN